MVDEHPTLLRIPAWYSELTHDEVVLPLAPHAYAVSEAGGRWRVTISDTDELIYWGTGPVEIVRSRAPF